MGADLQAMRIIEIADSLQKGRGKWTIHTAALLQCFGAYWTRLFAFMNHIEMRKVIHGRDSAIAERGQDDIRKGTRRGAS